MWKKIIGSLMLLSLLAGFLLIEKVPVIDPITPAPADITDSDEKTKQSRETVMADDEPSGSQAFSHTADNLAQPSYTPNRNKAEPPVKMITINNKQYPLRTYKPALVANDPYGSQWWVGNTRLNQAWDTEAGGNQTVLAIIDTGFGLAHEEFNNRWYTNSGEAGPATNEQPSSLNCADRNLALNANCNLIDDNRDGIIDNESGGANYQNQSRLNCTGQLRAITKDCNRIDDDNNGFIDDTRGWDFINNDNSVQAGELNPNGTGTQHGTMVAGVAAATGNNGKGLAGVDWNTKILPIQALDDDSYGDTLSVGQAIFYAAAQGADVISLSLGSDLSDDYVEEAVQKAISMGSVVVAAAGNDGCDCIIYPANYPEVVAVGALDLSSQRASFSSWGANLDILAPGTSMTSSTWTSGSPTNGYVSGINGTSFAAPIISGMLTRLIRQQPTASPLQLISALTENTNRLGLPNTTSHSFTLGYGTLDAAKVTARMATPDSSNLPYSFQPISGGGQLYPATPSEVPGTFSTSSCSAGTVGTTPIYELIKSGSHFFSISASEASQAKRAGYSSNIFAHVCLRQPHDTSVATRSLNLFSEFRNIYKRPNGP